MSADQSQEPQPSTSGGVIKRFPVENCPPTTLNNPWRPADRYFSKDGRYHITDMTAFSADKIEFFPYRAHFPKCYWRFHADVIAGSKIPAETVILPAGEASTALAGVARAADFKRLETGALGGHRILIQTQRDCQAPIYGKNHQSCSQVL